ncbi:ABC transporter substrate-binding protein [Amycolatopsis acidiphila]|uniref:ABC transporter substrate-binding protein n=1 Tax=Amycolatopsis acidiphila TaxID=715473 RepID=A0A558AC01_9PSEU|nr:ABC transporter substrate-binding protein [Amycolatopsis acidiphila]TVT21773.1 ABC transporter substrate-binding protein [Amycolatopsis acidiphila]UIJ61491.1 ABC transporter substrate-binding protein [Amycolatopsis acidiphila]GHG59618.1 4,5-dihydroxyphthalate decarboxylase [Amycolatopsis acidiphila]
MNRLQLSFACWDYDRMRALQDGRVRPEGIDLNFLSLPVEETFYRQLRHQEFDVCEMSLSSYLLTLNQDEPPFVALPVFPSRFFRHQSIYVNTAGGIDKPADLVGKRIGTPEYQMTAGVWQRGILAEEYGVPVDSVQYFTGGIEEPGRDEKIRLDLPDSISVTPIGPDQTLSEMLADGEIDAICSASQPSCFGRVPQVRHLFEDFTAVEKDYYRRTRIFPIMHTVVLRRELHERNPWIARSLTKAFTASLELAYEDLKHRNALKVMLPWLQQHLEETLDALGPGYWDYGLERNRHVLETFARYSYEQGLASRVRSPEEIVLASASDSFKL